MLMPVPTLMRVALIGAFGFATVAQAQITVPTFGTRGSVSDEVVIEFMVSLREALRIDYSAELRTRRPAAAPYTRSMGTSLVDDVVIASAVRTPIGSFQGVLSPLKASQLGAIAVREAVAQAGAGDGVDLVLMGNVLPAGMGQAPARQAAIYAGLGPATPTVTLNRMCGSGLEAVVQAARAVAVGDAEVVVAGGMEYS